MASKSVKRLGLSQDVLTRLRRAGIMTCKDILVLQPCELQQKIQLNIYLIQDIYQKAATKAAPVVKNLLTEYELRNSTARNLSTSFPILDKVLHGGIPAGSLTEIAGPSGCGKTQFSLMMCVTATLPRDLGGFNGKVLFIDTESTFSAHRLIEIARNKFPLIYDSDESLQDLASKVLVHQEHSCGSLSQRIANLEEEIIEHGIKFIVLDSVASLIRKEYGGSSFHSNIHRTNLLTTQASSLKKIAEDFFIPILVTNQITTRFASDDVTLSGGKGEGHVTAALGNSWSHNVNSRLILQYLETPLRQMRIAKSPVAPFASLIYTIEAEGLVLKEGSGECYEGTDPGMQAIQVRTSGVIC